MGNLQLEEIAGKVSADIRTALVEPAEVIVLRLTRIASQSYSPEVAEHAIEQLKELRAALKQKLKSDVFIIERLAHGLEKFERRLAEMSRGYLR